MRAVVIAGPKKSGKTALIALIAEALEKRGKRVGIVKFSSHALEKSNTDAFWLMRSNRVVVNASPEETAVFWPQELSFEAIVNHVAVDVLLCEGGAVPGAIPRIVCQKEGCEDDTHVEHCTMLATVGDGSAVGNISHYPSLEPASAEAMATLIMEKGAVL